VADTPTVILVQQERRITKTRENENLKISFVGRAFQPDILGKFALNVRLESLTYANLNHWPTNYQHRMKELSPQREARAHLSQN
jgi:hypothetical protein